VQELVGVGDHLGQVGGQAAELAGTPFGQPGSTNLLRLAEIWPQ